MGRAAAASERGPRNKSGEDELLDGVGVPWPLSGVPSASASAELLDEFRVRTGAFGPGDGPAFTISRSSSSLCRRG